MGPPSAGRRRYLRLAGATAVAAVAGCTGSDTDDGAGPDAGDDHTVSADVVETGRIHYGELDLAADEWLTETTVGGRARNYDGTFLDARNRETVRVDVGAEPEGRAFDPVAVVVSPGTLIVWEWIGDGGAHSVVADPAAQIGESDYGFDSGDPVSGGDVTFDRELPSVGNCMYHCGRHLESGMKGVVAVW